MSNTGIRSFDSSIIKTKEWLKDVRDELALDSEEEAFDALRAVLHVLRDRLTPNEAADLAAQLPLVMRGLYFDGWRPAAAPVKYKRPEEFLQGVHDGLTRKQDPKFADPGRVVQGVFKVLEKRVSQGEMRQVKEAFPEKLRSLWPSGHA